MKKFLLLFLAVYLPFFGEEENASPPPIPNHYQLLFDYHLSPKAAGSSMISVHKGIETAAEKAYTLEKPSSTQALLRFAEMFFGWMPLNRIAVVTQHEVFGHGYRLREFGSSIGKVQGYVVKPPVPYGLGGGATGYRPTDKLGPMHKLMISIAGMEGTSILAHELATSWFETGSVDPKRAYMYISSRHDPTTYTLLMQNQLPEAGKGHDMESYFFLLRRLYPGSKLSVNQLKMLALLNFADPMTYAATNSLWHYVITGKPQNLHLKQLWNLRVGMAPYGPEGYIEHHRYLKEKPIYTYVKMGQYAKNRYFGCGFEHRHIWEFGPHKLGMRAEAWVHPKLNFATQGFTHEKMYSDESYGIHPLGYLLGAKLMGTYTIQGDGPLGAQVHLGAKTPGYLPGESYSAAPIIRASFNLKF